MTVESDPLDPVRAFLAEPTPVAAALALKAFRAVGVSQQRLSEASGLHVAVLSRLENRPPENLRTKTLHRLRDGLQDVLVDRLRSGVPLMATEVGGANEPAPIAVDALPPAAVGHREIFQLFEEVLSHAGRRSTVAFSFPQVNDLQRPDSGRMPWSDALNRALAGGSRVRHLVDEVSDGAKVPVERLWIPAASGVYEGPAPFESMLVPASEPRVVLVQSPKTSLCMLLFGTETDEPLAVLLRGDEGGARLMRAISWFEGRLAAGVRPARLLMRTVSADSNVLLSELTYASRVCVHAREGSTAHLPESAALRHFAEGRKASAARQAMELWKARNTRLRSGRAHLQEVISARWLISLARDGAFLVREERPTYRLTPDERLVVFQSIAASVGTSAWETRVLGDQNPSTESAEDVAFVGDAGLEFSLIDDEKVFFRRGPAYFESSALSIADRWAASSARARPLQPDFLAHLVALCRTLSS